jgi:hypothetical protein
MAHGTAGRTAPAHRKGGPTVEGWVRALSEAAYAVVAAWGVVGIALVALVVIALAWLAWRAARR